MTNRDTAAATLGNAVESEAALPQVLQDIQFLIDLQREMREQVNDCQASPRFWAVGDYRQVECMEDNADCYYVYSPEAGDSYKLDDYLKDLEEEEEMSGEELEEFKEIGCEESALEWIQKYRDSGAYVVPTKREHFVRENTMFLTKAEAKRHIELNHYHYTSEAHTYAMTAWRAPKVERLMKILHEFDFERFCSVAAIESTEQAQAVEGLGQGEDNHERY